MIPVHCRVKHDPEAGTYGDCLRACVASLLDVARPEDVPHFYEDNCSGEEGMARVATYLATVGYVPFYTVYDGGNTLDGLLAFLGEQNPTAHYILFGGTIEGGDHVVIGYGGKIVHNPAWYGSSIVGPGSTGVWVTMVLARP